MLSCKRPGGLIRQLSFVDRYRPGGLIKQLSFVDRYRLVV